MVYNNLFLYDDTRTEKSACLRERGATNENLYQLFESTIDFRPVNWKKKWIRSSIEWKFISRFWMAYERKKYIVKTSVTIEFLWNPNWYP